MDAGELEGQDLAVSLGRGKLDVDGLLALLGCGNEVGKVHVGIRAGDEVHVVLVEELLLDALGHAAEDADDEALLVLPQGMEILEAAVDFLLGVVADGASVDEDGVGIGDDVRHFVAGHLHDGGDDFAVGDVHLAAVGFDVQFLFITLGSGF